MKNNITKSEVQFWGSIIGGICLTLIYFFDFKSDIIQKVDVLDTRLSIIEHYIKDLSVKQEQVNRFYTQGDSK